MVDLSSGDWPNTAAARRAQAFFEVFALGDPEELIEFEKTHGAKTRVAAKGPEQRMKKWRRQKRTWQALVPHRVVTGGPHHLFVLAETKRDRRWLSFHFSVEKESPNGLLEVEWKRARKPR